MKGARGLALIAGIGFIAAGVWQVLIYSGAPASGQDIASWFIFFESEPMVGKTWGLRIAATLLAVAPLYAIGDRAKTGWGRAARAFAGVWLPIVLVACIFQTVSIERLRAIAEAGGAETDPARVAFTMWDAVVEPTTAVGAVLGALAFSMFVAGCGGRMPVFGVVVLIAMMAMVVFAFSPRTEAAITLVNGALLCVLAFAAPRERENPLHPN